ncbi:capreomycidine synthase [Acrasis kona]|uniref:Capreomycidine synthase n=1 Tax=Acrasis kona TaxID=1008807 RepID=A0AAW2Z1Q7_9EUKA
MIPPRVFKLERYFAKYEFCTKHLLCCSDCETMTIKDVLGLTDNCDELTRSLLDIPLGYTETTGDLSLRKNISRLYTNIDAESIVVTTGAVEPLLLFSITCLEPNDVVIIQSPIYQALEEGPMIRDCRILHWDMVDNEANKCWSFDIKDLEKLFEQNKVKALILNAPHNPTGFNPTLTNFNRIIDLCRRQGTILFCDEVYKFLDHDDHAEHLPNAADAYENAISMNVMTKSFGLAGLRIGWIASQNKQLLDKIASGKDYTTICNSAPSEFISKVALDKHKVILNKNREIIRKNLEAADQFFLKHKETFEWRKPTAGPVGLVKFKKGSVAEFCDRVVKEAGILLLPSGMYDAEHLESFRLGFGRSNFIEVLNVFDDYLTSINY